MTYPLMPVPYCIDTVDGFVMMYKSKSFHHLTKNIADAKAPNASEALMIYDGNAYSYHL